MPSLNNCLQCCFLIVFCIINNIQTVPPDYCLYPLNRTDCHVKPTPVFSYFKPGSRCEIEMWRGCPTFNKFNNEYECSHVCIFRQGRIGFDENITSPDLVPVVEETTNECEGTLNTNVCSDNATTVYTHINGSCVEATWYGCTTRNKFQDKSTCLEVCLNENLTEWKHKLEELPEEEVEEIDQILDEILEDETGQMLFMKEEKVIDIESSESEEQTEPPAYELQDTDSGYVSEVVTTRKKLNGTNKVLVWRDK